MVDVHDSKTRSRNMAAIKSNNTKPELLVRQALFSNGYRYRLHVDGLPGKPDIVMKKFRTVIFVHGCFWHLHDCHLCKLPKSNKEFWDKKLRLNKKRDEDAVDKLLTSGWRVIIVWECAIRGKTKLSHDELISRLIKQIKRSDDRPKEESVYHLCRD